MEEGEEVPNPTNLVCIVSAVHGGEVIYVTS